MVPSTSCLLLGREALHKSSLLRAHADDKKKFRRRKPGGHAVANCRHAIETAPNNATCRDARPRIAAGWKGQGAQHIPLLARHVGPTSRLRTIKHACSRASALRAAGACRFGSGAVGERSAGGSGGWPCGQRRGARSPVASQGGDAACPLSPTHHLDLVLRATSTSPSCGSLRDRRCRERGARSRRLRYLAIR